MSTDSLAHLLPLGLGARIILALAAPVLVGAAKKDSFSVRVNLLSGWQATTQAAQTLEMLRDLDSQGPLRFLQKLQLSPSNLSGVTSSLVQSRSARTLHGLAVENKYYSPRIEALRTLGRQDRQRFGRSCDASSWVLVYDGGAKPTAVCTPDQLQTKLQALGNSGDGDAADFLPSGMDHVLVKGNALGRTAVLYGDLDDVKTVCDFLKAFNLDSGSQSPWTVVFRHADSLKSDTGPDKLSGYGVELAIKSSEYKATADEGKESKDEEEDGSAEADQSEGSDKADAIAPAYERLTGPVEVDGFAFHTLLKRYGDIKKQLWEFKEQLEAEQDTDVPLRSWEMKEMGLQAVAKIRSSETPLLALQRLSQDFPGHAVALSRTSVPETYRKGMNKLRRSLREGAEVITINGRIVRPDHSDLSVFPIMKSMQPYFIGIERAVRVGLPEITACKLLRESSQASSMPERLDWRSEWLPPPVFDVKKDERTQRWPTELQQLLYGFPGSLSPIRMALYKIVFIFDPADFKDMEVAAFMLQQPLPANVYFVMGKGGAAAKAEWSEEMLGAKPAWLKEEKTDDLPDDKSTGLDLSRVVADMFGHLLKEGRKKHVKRVKLFIQGLDDKHPDIFGKGDGDVPSEVDSVEALSKIFKAAAPKDEQATIEATTEAILKHALPNGHAANATKYIDTVAIPTPAMMVNGKVYLKGTYDTEGFLLQVIAHEQQGFQQAVYMGQIRNEKGIEEHIAGSGLLGAYHEDITPEVAQRGGEEGMPGNEKEVHYVQWPYEPYSKISFLESIEQAAVDVEDETGENDRLGLFHITFLSDLRHFYLLKSFAEHLLRPDREALTRIKSMQAPPVTSRWAPLVAVPPGSAHSEALIALRSCIRALLGLGATLDDAESLYSLNRQKLLFLKYLGAAVEVASEGTSLNAGTGDELCKLAMSKKLDPDMRPVFEKRLVAEKETGSSPTAEESAMLLAATRPGATATDAIWVCNGRYINLKVESRRVNQRHIQTLEIFEMQFDVSVDEPEEPEGMMGGQQPPESKEPVVPLNRWLANSKVKLPFHIHGLIAAIRSETLTAGGKFSTSGAPKEYFEQAPSSYKLSLEAIEPELPSPISVYGLVNPLSTTAQSSSALLAMFREVFNADVHIVLNPPTRLNEYPIKRYYREVIKWPSTFLDGRTTASLESDIGGSAAEFPVLATKHTLTVAMHVLPTWLVTSYEAENDLDNLRIKDVGRGKVAEATYVLKQLYTEGQAFIQNEDGWPIAAAKGLQVELLERGVDSNEAAIFDDTVVMRNLGYFQLVANPGMYSVKLKSGLSNDTFTLASPDSFEVSSYIPPPYQLRVRTRPGRSPEDVFEQGADGKPLKRRKKGGLASIFGGMGGMGGLASMFGFGHDDFVEEENEETTPPPTVVSESDELPTIHIFSVASGHLYERLLSIMILSVRRNTKCPLHFWFIDNFLSPKFKSFIPHMAKKFNFAFDFVSYKWPSWLNPQTEKQRLIWAYKILFLDVLFPLEVPKIIFIDADQVVRADVKELWDTNLKGKAYGFTPMGNSNPDTEGFRFWKQGYWKNHLGDLHYHISALFVVDLVEFRRMATGDQLRGIYNTLSRDPNSLANLDQDLPNFAQQQVPIHSLPQDWLWCETWCSQETKKTAKTIDLCQNPLTKEPKIVMAKRIISEWEGYHDEIQKFQAVLDLNATSATQIATSAASTSKTDKASISKTEL